MTSLHMCLHTSQFPVVTTVPGLAGVNYPDVCTNQPVRNKAFCAKHMKVAKERGYHTSVRDFRRFLQLQGSEIKFKFTNNRHID